MKNTHLVYKCRNCENHEVWIDTRTSPEGIMESIKIMGNSRCPNCKEFDWIYDRLGNYEIEIMEHEEV